ncbi:MarR family winged helix-turn-helix transcriptional regulator [Neglectibacter sp. X58]|uniref:MarR family winged helix-turn-helix transcriptional regulator n=1 Tax=unclassified Neglectibacter TaxID=2632164 RepID=UPI00325B795B
MTQKKISDFSMIDPMTVSSTLRLLEKKGLTQRIQSKVDSRANTICNTDNGLSVLKEAIKAVESVDISFFFETENDTEVFQKLLFQLKNKNNKNL